VFGSPAGRTLLQIKARTRHRFDDAPDPIPIDMTPRCFLFAPAPVAPSLRHG